MLFAFRSSARHPVLKPIPPTRLKSALELISREKYDVVISDLNLTGAHGQQGFEIVRAAKRNNPLIRTLSGLPMPIKFYGTKLRKIRHRRVSDKAGYLHHASVNYHRQSYAMACQPSA